MKKTVFIVGAGIMGRGIAQAVAEYGFDARLFDTLPGAGAKGMAGISRALDKRIEKNEIAVADKQAILERIRPAGGMNEAAAAGFVIEAVKEDLAVKQAVFRELDKLCPTDTILGTNTSALKISDLAAVTMHPERVIGIHFFNPAPRMPVVEVIPGAVTNPATVAATREFATAIGKTVVLARETPGFVINRLLIPLINEAICALQEGVATREDIDAAMKLGANHPMGPLVLADMIGLDVILSIMETLEKGFDDTKYRPSPLLRQMVAAGKLGRKTGTGFYDYTG